MRSSIMLSILASVAMSAGGCHGTKPEATHPDMRIATPAGLSPPAAAAWEALMGPDGEYAAWAMYGAVIQKFGQVEPYVSIQQAEGRHIEALTRQLNRLGVQVPDNPYIGKVTAPASLKEAAAAWAEGEIANVALYDRLMQAAASDPNLPRVFGNLRNASLNAHLPMFRKAAEGDGTLTQAQMMEFQGHGHGQGHGRRGGQGRGHGGGAAGEG